MGWSKWKSFVDVNWGKVPNVPGVYYIRCVDDTKEPCKIIRLGGVDPEGIIYIGETGQSLRKRLIGFWKTAQNYREDQHRAGWNFSYHRYNKLFPVKNQEFSYFSCQGKSQTRRIEAECLWEYRRIKKFLDLPPLNFSSGQQDI